MPSTLRRVVMALSVVATLLLAVAGGSPVHAASSSHNSHGPRYIQLCGSTTWVDDQSATYYDSMKINGGSYAIEDIVTRQVLNDAVQTTYYCGKVRSKYYLECRQVGGCPTFTIATRMELWGGQTSQPVTLGSTQYITIYGSPLQEANPTAEPADGTWDGWLDKRQS